jgi:competence ComEA-like helix-hairpin-helix protein
MAFPFTFHLLPRVFMKTFSRGQQGVVLLIIFGMTLLYFNSINQSTLPYKQLSHPATDHRPLTTVNLSGSQLLTLNKRININTATKTDLEAIRGIGPRTAEKIVEYRQEHGMFKRIEDLMKVNGIKEKGLEKIMIYLTVE